MLTHYVGRLPERNRNQRGTGTESAIERLAAIEARDDLRGGCPKPSMRNYSRKPLPGSGFASSRCLTWDAFQLLAIEGRSGAEVARQLNMKVATVFVARSKVQRMLREEGGAAGAGLTAGPRRPETGDLSWETARPRRASNASWSKS